MDPNNQTSKSDPGRAAVDLQSLGTTPVVPVPASPKLKEQGPVTVPETTKPAEPDWETADKVAKEEGDEYWEKYAREIELEKELEAMGGIEKVESGEVKVPEKIAKEMGIKPTTDISTPIEVATGFSIRGISLSDDQLSIGIKKPTSSGFKWLVEWFIYQLLKAHYHIKLLHGRIVREKDKEKID